MRKAFLCLALGSAFALPGYGSGIQVHAAGTVAGAAGAAAYAGYLVVPAGSAVASVGPLFPVGLGGCTRTGQNGEATALSSNLAGFASTGSLDDKASSTYSSTLISAQASATVQSVNVLAGLITATAVQSAVSSSARPAGASSTNNSTFANLVVGTTVVGATVAPNTTIALSGIGTVVLNEQSVFQSGGATAINVIAIHVYVKVANSLGLPVGTQIIIARAHSDFTPLASNSILSAKAYALYSIGNVGSINATSGPWAPASIGCTGGSSTVTLASASVANIGSTAAMQDTATGSLTSDGGDSSASSSVSTVNLLGGLVTADLVQSSASAGLHSGVATRSDTTSLVNAQVGSVAVAANPPPNTRVNLAGFGYAILNHQMGSVSSTAVSANVIAIDIYITTSNTLGLPAGTRIIVGSSYAQVHA